MGIFIILNLYLNIFSNKIYKMLYIKLFQYFLIKLNLKNLIK